MPSYLSAWLIARLSTRKYAATPTSGMLRKLSLIDALINSISASLCRGASINIVNARS